MIAQPVSCISDAGFRSQRDKASVSLSTQCSSSDLFWRVAVPSCTVRHRLPGPLSPGSFAIRKKINGYRFTVCVIHAYSMCVRLSGSLAYPDIFGGKRKCAAKRGLTAPLLRVLFTLSMSVTSKYAESRCFVFTATVCKYRISPNVS